MKRDHNKIVRDGIPQYLLERGIRSSTRIIPEEERLRMVLGKLSEEAEEARGASPEKLAEELADVLEIIQSAGVLAGISWDKIVQTQIDKRSQRGSFLDGVFLEYTIEPD